MQPAPNHRPPHPAPPRPRRTVPRRLSLRSSYVIAGGLLTVGSVVVLGAVLLAVLLLYTAPASTAQPAIAEGVSVAGLSLGGKSLDAATQELEAHNFAAQPIRLTDADRFWIVSLGELGVRVDIPQTVQLADDAAPGTALQPWYAVDLNQTQMALLTLSAQTNIAAMPGNPPQAGRAMEIPTILNRLYENLTGEIADGVLELSMIEVQAPAADPVANYTGQTTVHVVEPGQELGLIARLYGVDMQQIVALNNLTNPDLLFVGQELTIPAGGVYAPSAADAPPAPLASGKAIVVSTGDQRIYAYENGALVHSYLVSTGLPDTPTVLGDFKIYRKYEKTDMSGPGYYLPDVPYTMYFYQGYGIHGTYWHNSFGRPMSHGCVNLPTDQARWFFNWAEVGTLVRVI